MGVGVWATGGPRWLCAMSNSAGIRQVLRVTTLWDETLIDNVDRPACTMVHWSWRLGLVVALFEPVRCIPSVS